MKKTILLGVLMLSAATVFAQESRQDVSFSSTGLFGPTIHGANGVVTNSTGALGLLTSYRFMLTPHSALEANYSFIQNNQKYCIGGDCVPGGTYTSGVGNPTSYRIHSRMQEMTFAYVFGMTFKRYNPFVEVGGGGLIFTPVLDNETTYLGTKGTKGIAGLMGGGLAYELSPSFDIRVEYRGLLTKTPAFGFNSGSPDLNANRYEVLSMPTLGVAYHF
jgi:hypothetical protein